MEVKLKECPIKKFIAILFALISGLTPLALGHAQTLEIKAGAASIPMGQSVVVKAHLRPSIPGTATDYLVTVRTLWTDT